MKKEQKKYLKCRDTRYRAQKERGITLIALVITIILLLILAGVTLKIVLDNNFVDKAEKSVEKYSEAQKNETEQIKYFLENYLGEVDNTEGTEHRTLNGADPAYNNPIIPVGFKTSSDGASWSSIDGKTVQGWNDGLVIEDKEGNQFVWVPVDGKNVKYEKWCTIGVAYNHSDISDDTLPNGVSSEESQIGKYGGFYIGRYEAGIPTTLGTAISTASEDARNINGTPISKKNQVPWNFIDYTTSKANAESMYTGEKVKSGLLTGTMWDTTMKWLENSGVNVTTDSRGWGNYIDAPVTGITYYSPYASGIGASWTSADWITKPTDKESNDPAGSWLLKTGNTDYTKKKNIYDLAGSEYEWTNEVFSSKRLIRGGCFIYRGDRHPSTFRYLVENDHCNDVVSYRIGLYIQ